MFEILDYLAYSQFKMGRIYTAYRNTQDLLKIGLFGAKTRPIRINTFYSSRMG